MFREKGRSGPALRNANFTTRSRAKNSRAVIRSRRGRFLGRKSERMDRVGVGDRARGSREGGLGYRVIKNKVNEVRRPKAMWVMGVVKLGAKAEK